MAIGIANEMKQIFGEKLELNIYTTDSKEAQKYNFRSSTNVLLDQELVPLEVSTDKNKMKDYILNNL